MSVALPRPPSVSDSPLGEGVGRGRGVAPVMPPRPKRALTLGVSVSEMALRMSGRPSVASGRP